MAIAKVIQKFGSHEEMRIAQVREWQKLPPEVITAEAWQLVVDYRKMHGIEPHEPRLERKITSVRRAWVNSDLPSQGEK